jgi:16S rRNA (adenine1518-N6/adenine1519-N6)-dimethyltransferase
LQSEPTDAPRRPGSGESWHDPRVVLRDAGLRPKRRLGQHFLVAEAIGRAIAAACVPEDEVGRARVVEIGGGTGALSRLLAGRAHSLVTIEHDRALAGLLERELVHSSARVVEGDALEVDIAALLDAMVDGPRVLCGNLPYAITGPLLRRSIDCVDRVDRVVFMMQREVAERLAARPGTKSWGALTVFVRAAYDARRLMRAGPGAFHPPPEVASTVVELIPLHPRRAHETPRFRSLVKSAFGARRKTLRNAWAGLAEDRNTLALAADASRISLDARGETLDVEDFARMATALDGG